MAGQDTSPQAFPWLNWVFGVSRTTVQRRLTEAGFSVQSPPWLSQSSAVFVPPAGAGEGGKNAPKIGLILTDPQPSMTLHFIAAAALLLVAPTPGIRQPNYGLILSHP